MSSDASRSRGRLLLAITVALIAVAFVVGALAGDSDSTRSGRPPSEPGRVLWNGDVSTGDLSQYKVQECAPGRTTVVRDPKGADRNVIRFTVRDTDVAPCTPTGNPRAQALSPSLLRPGGDYWIGWAVLVPDDFPRTTGAGDEWISLGSIYGPPADGNGSNGISMNTSPGAEEFYYRRGAEYDFDQPWQMPLVRGRWVDFVFHVKLSADPKVGYREQWVDSGSGWAQSKLAGQSRFFTSTFGEANGGAPNVSKISLYRRRGIMETATLYFAGHRIGTSFDSVAPGSYGEE